MNISMHLFVVITDTLRMDLTESNPNELFFHVLVQHIGILSV